MATRRNVMVITVDPDCFYVMDEELEAFEDDLQQKLQKIGRADVIDFKLLLIHVLF